MQNVFVFCVLGMWVWTAPVESRLDENNLPTITQFIRNRYGITGMYAMAIAIPDCNQNLGAPTLESIVGSDTSDTVTNRLNTGQIYEGERVIAARPLEVTDNDNERLYTEHAEFRLLSGPLQHLRSRNQGACLFFFVLASPCLDKCLNRNNRNNIIPLLGEFTQWSEKAARNTAFVFHHIFDKNPDNSTGALWDGFQPIWGRVSLYRCTGRQCHNCEVTREEADQNRCYRN
ncbi:uncharacterized protein [Lepisosteus oculatus]|uniref:uncharacterized protein isoform X1 n=1 Tax=Lepisosteus oculatus TaxID=7918 RepID=UPI003710ACED